MSAMAAPFVRVPIGAARYAFWPTPRGSGFHIATPDMFRKALVWHARQVLVGMGIAFTDHTGEYGVDDDAALSIRFQGCELEVVDITGDGLASYSFNEVSDDEDSWMAGCWVGASSLSEFLDKLVEARDTGRSVTLSAGAPAAVRVIRTWEMALDEGFDLAIAAGVAKVYGRPRDPLAPFEHVTPAQWRYFTLTDAERGTAEGPGDAMLYDLHLEIMTAKRPRPADAQKPARSKGGAPPKWDWAAVEDEALRRIREEGPPGLDAPPGWRTKSDLIGYMRRLAVRGQKGDEEPSDSTIKPYATRVLKRAEAERAET
jgi:hypothetical protein